MKYIFFCAIFTLCVIPVMAEKISKQPEQFFNWGLLWNGAWEENKSLANRGDLRIGNPRSGLQLRGQILDKRPLDFSLPPLWGSGEKTDTEFAGGLYHKPTGSRLLYGVLDEWGLSARVRSPWIRGAPFAENHQPLFADLKTAVSAEKKPEAYLYLSSPLLNFIPKTALRTFAAAQTKTEEFSPDLMGGVEARFGSAAKILLEGFYTNSKIPARASSAWFSNPPPLPEREFKLYAAGLLASSPFLSLSSDWAWSETFALGRGIYGNAALRVNPLFFAAGKKPGPLSVSLAADGAESRFTGRDGKNPGAGFRTAGKAEWKGQRASLFRAAADFRAPRFGENFTRGSSAVYYRFPASVRGKNTAAQQFPLGMRRVSLGIDRNADNPAKIIDSANGSLGFSLNLPNSRITRALGINFSGSIKGLCSTNETPPPFPLPQYPYRFNSAKAAGELSWAWEFFQVRTKWGYEHNAKNEGSWDASFGVSARYKAVRFGVKIETPDFPDKWNYSLSWRVEKKY